MEVDVAPPTPKPNSFGPVHILDPLSQHTHTAILLHGRGSNGEEFAEELSESRLLGQPTLAQRLPGWRFVYPSSCMLWSTEFEEEIPAWFEAHSLTDVTERQDLQIEGIRESVRYLTTIVDEEIDWLRVDARKVVLGGISQAGAIGMWTLLCSEGSIKRLGAFVGASTWLPFAECIETFLGQDGESRRCGSKSTEAHALVESMMDPLRRSLAHPHPHISTALPSTPVFLGHGIDDAYVDLDLGRQARRVLDHIGLKVDWEEYRGAELEGHWLKVPEEVDDIANFLMNTSLPTMSAG